MNSVEYTEEACSLLNASLSDVAANTETERNVPNDQAALTLSLDIDTVSVLQELHVAPQHVEVHADFGGVHKGSTSLGKRSAGSIVIRQIDLRLMHP